MKAAARVNKLILGGRGTDDLRKPNEKAACVPLCVDYILSLKMKYTDQKPRR
jgi:hypothetical protein